MGKGNEKKERKGNPFLRCLKGFVFFPHRPGPCLLLLVLGGPGIWL